MEENPIRYDYTESTRQSGWAVVDFDFLGAGKAKMTAFGLKRGIPHNFLKELYILPGEEVVISMPDGEVLYEVARITYHHDPYDMYEAELNYIQHLTGLRIVTQDEPTQTARHIEWSRRHHRGS